MLPALLVVVEGPDGSGKTRQTDAVVDALCARGLAASAFHHTRTGASSDAYCAALDYAHQRAGACLVANAAQRFATEVRALERGASPDEACDAFDEMERLARESFPVLRATRGEAGL